MKDELLLIELGKRISSKRKALGLSQEEFAEKANVTAQMVSTAERGEKAIRPENLLKISKGLGVSADYLLTGELTPTDLILLNGKLKLVNKNYLLIIDKIIDGFLELQ